MNIWWEYIIVRARFLIAGSALLALSACGNTGDVAAKPDTSAPAAAAGPSVKDAPEKGTDMTEQPTTGGPANYARDGNIAIQEEFQDAELKGTVAAYEMFMARHPDHELSKLAEIRIAEIKTKKKTE